MTNGAAETRLDRRETILDAAEALILRHGIDGIRAQSLADEAGISIATPYHYFESLDAVIAAAHARSSEQGATRRDAVVAAAGDDPVAQLRALLVDDFTGTQEEVREAWLVRLEYQRRAIFDDALRAGIRAGEQEALSRLMRIVEAGQTARSIPGTVAASRLAARLLALSCGLGALLLVDVITSEHARALLLDAVDDRASWQSAAPEHAEPAAWSEPSEPPREDRATEILDQTIALIAEAGVAGVHFRDVALRAGTSLTLPRYYFPTIPRLVAAAFARDLEIAQARMGPTADAITDPVERLGFTYMPKDARQLAARRPTLVLWFEYLRLGERDPEARAAGRARLAAWIDFSIALGQDLALAGIIPAERVTRIRAERIVAVNTGASGLWLLGLLSDDEFAAVMNGVIDDEIGRQD
jgi:AcrR family transcriptional regulator